jgi:hypothetical protein
MPAGPAPHVARAVAFAVAAGALFAPACASTRAPGDAALPDDPAVQPPRATPCLVAGSESLGQAGEALTIVDRSLVGNPTEYAADATLRRREAELQASTRSRRELGWSVAGRVVGAVSLSGSLGEGVMLPTWQTWHNEDDLTRIFRRLYPELSPEERASRAPFDPGSLDEAWSWNDDASNDFEAWTLDRLSAYRTALDTSAKRAGVGGVYRVAYSPAASRHILESYGPLLDCRVSDARVEATPAEAPVSTPAEAGGCGGAPSYAPACLSGQFPDSSVLVKATWQRLDAGVPFFAYDTSAESLEQKLAPDGAAAWGDGDRPAEPREDEMYTIELPNGNRFGLTGLHIMTKELEHWVWVSLWWSDQPDADFGADRPQDFPAPFAHYKLCSVVSFDDGDPDPTGGFADDHPSLARALQATRFGGGASWCSNPYIERGAGNAATNCIGCHQHAGTSLDAEAILADRDAFPDFARAQVRQSFASDYVFSVRTGDDLGAMFVETEEHYAAP